MPNIVVICFSYVFSIFSRLFYPEADSNTAWNSMFSTATKPDRFGVYVQKSRVCRSWSLSDPIFSRMARFPPIAGWRLSGVFFAKKRERSTSEQPHPPDRMGDHVFRRGCAMNHACKTNIVIGYYTVMWMYAYASEHMYYNIQTVKKSMYVYL